MIVERLRSTTFRITTHAIELATLISAVRWAAEGGQGELTDEARAQLAKLLADYEVQRERLSKKA